MKKPLTKKQFRVLNILKEYILENNQSPTLQELATELNLKSLRTVTQFLDILERKLYIVRKRNISRNIQLFDIDAERRQNRTITVPVVASVGCDDLSVYGNDDLDEYIEVDENMVNNPKEIVAVRAIGDSMKDAGISSGDYILIQFTDRFQNGDRVAAIVNDMVVVKRFEKRNNHIILRPESKDPKYKPIIVRDNFKITGKVLCVIPSTGAEITEVIPL